MTTGDSGTLSRRAAASTVWSLARAHAAWHPDRTAVEDGALRRSYAELCDRAARLSGVLDSRGVARGDRVALLSENRAEYLEVVLACARIGAAVACQNLRLAAPELSHCLSLVEPKLTLVSERHAARVGDPKIVLGDDYEARLAEAEAGASADAPEDDPDVDPEDALVILYTSGTTGLPKGAVVSHRAEIARNLVMRAELGLESEDAFVAWSPLYHMGALDPALGALMSGGSVIVVDGFDPGRLAEVVATRAIGWLLVMPGTVAALAGALREAKVKPRGVRVCGVMADLVPPAELAEITRLLDAPYANTFGATETGCPPCSSSLLPVGVAPERLSKVQSAHCEVRLVDPEDRDVEDGAPGELCMRGPTLFSGYFRAEAANAEAFRGGWFHMGDVFVRNPDRTLEFVDRVKYLIKSGGENVYPAEIERVIRADPRVADVAVVRRPDARWGEVPVAFVARTDETLTPDAILARCREALAGYKQPKEILFIGLDELPRSTSGKVVRHELEKRLSQPRTP